MVAGRRFRGHNEQGTAEHQTGCGGDLGVEAVIEDRLGPRKTRRLFADVEAGGQIDQEDDREAEQAKHEDDSPEPTASLVAQRPKGEKRRKQRHGDQQVGVGLAGGLGIHGRRGRSRQPGIARLADLDRAVLGELGCDQERRGGEDGQADRTLWGEHRAGAGGDTPRPGSASQQAPFEQGKATEENHADRAQATAEASAGRARRAPNAIDRWPGPLQLPVDRPVEPASRREGARDRIAQALSRSAWRRPDAPPRRCYHRASLRLLFRSSFRRAREGLFHAPIPAVLAGRP